MSSVSRTTTDSFECKEHIETKPKSAHRACYSATQLMKAAPAASSNSSHTLSERTITPPKAMEERLKKESLTLDIPFFGITKVCLGELPQDSYCQESLYDLAIAKLLGKEEGGKNVSYNGECLIAFVLQEGAASHPKLGHDIQVMDTSVIRDFKIYDHGKVPHNGQNMTVIKIYSIALEGMKLCYWGTVLDKSLKGTQYTSDQQQVLDFVYAHDEIAGQNKQKAPYLHAKMQREVAEGFKYGKGIYTQKQDLEKAFYWYEQAALNKDYVACDALEEIWREGALSKLVSIPKEDRLKKAFLYESLAARYCSDRLTKVQEEIELSEAVPLKTSSITARMCELKNELIDLLCRLPAILYRLALYFLTGKGVPSNPKSAKEQFNKILALPLPETSEENLSVTSIRSRAQLQLEKMATAEGDASLQPPQDSSKSAREDSPNRTLSRNHTASPRRRS